MKRTIRPASLALGAAAVILLGQALCPTRAVAQGLFGTISGVVSDPSGAVIPNATVRVTNANTGVVIVLQTNTEGVYVATSLNPGVYNVQAEAPGFKVATANRITLEVSAHPKVDLTLEVGQASESVSVVADAVMLQTEQSSVSQTVTRQQLQDLPVQGGNGRSVWNLVSLSAGITQQIGGNGFALDNMRINGGRPRMDDYLIDGTSMEQVVFGGPGVDPSVDAIQELNVQTNAFSAEYGKVSGGVLSIVTKTGTNQFHGTAYEYLKNDALDARDFFARSRLPLRFNEFGGSLGGPIIRDKLFFFSDYQGIRNPSSSPQIDLLVPSAAFRSGDLSALGKQLINPATGDAFPRNQVPVSPIAQKVLAMYPEGNGGPTGTPGIDYWSGVLATKNTYNRFNPRVDWNLGANDRFFGVYHFQRNNLTNESAFGGTAAGTNFTKTKDSTITAGWTHTFSSSLMNDFRFGWTHHEPLRTTNGYGVSSPGDFGIQGFPACNLPESNGKCGAPTINISGYTGVGGGGSMLSEPAGQTQFSNELTKVVGRHTLKIGGEIRHAHIDNIQPNQLTGSFGFNGGGTGNPFADFLIDYLYQSSVQVQTNYLKTRNLSGGVFFQDDFKLSSRLTVNAGLRWQYDPSWTSPLHQLANFNPYSLTWEQNGINAPEGAIDTHWREFAPRVGLAWNVRRGFVVRAGYGITYPGYWGHGRAGDAAASPNALAVTQFSPGTYLSNLPAFNLPKVNGPLAVYLGEYAYYTPRQQPPTYAQQWNLTLEQQLTGSTIVQLAYTGSHGVHLPIQYGYNVCEQSAENVQRFGSAAGNMDSPYCGPGNAAALGGFYGDYVYPGWWGISSSSYHALQAKIEKRYSNGFMLLANFTWSKLMDDSSSDWSGFGSLDVFGTSFYNRRLDRSLSAGDAPARLTIAPIYEFPAGPGKKYLNKGAVAEVLGGWAVSAIYTASSGEPLGVSDGGYRYGNAARMIGVRPNLVGSVLPSGFHQTINQWFNTDAFDWSGTSVYSSNLLHEYGPSDQGVPGLQYGTTPRFLANPRAPGINNLDLSLQKEFKLPLGEEARLRFRADAFNLLNHTQFNVPNTTADANFGKITATRIPARLIQLGLHLYF